MAENDSAFSKVIWIIVTAVVTAVAGGVVAFIVGPKSAPTAVLRIEGFEGHPSGWNYDARAPIPFVSRFSFDIKNVSSRFAKNVYVSVKPYSRSASEDYEDHSGINIEKGSDCSWSGDTYNFMFTCGNLEPGAGRRFYFATPEKKPRAYRLAISIGADDYAIKEEYRVCDYRKTQGPNVEGAYYMMSEVWRTC